MNAQGAWRTAPRSTVVLFLLAVFCVFSVLGFANDVIDMGRQHALFLVTSVILSGLFSVAYAWTGIALRGKFWKAFLPLLALQSLTMTLLSSMAPDSPLPSQLNLSEIHLVQLRLKTDAFAIILAVCLGYAGFVYVFIREGRRYIRANADKVKLEAEMAAATQVQQLMVPSQAALLPGFQVESIYRPASQVGGDFFQMIPALHGGLFLVLGDVAGKGLPAAMVVSMLVGAIRAIAEETNDPAIMLQKLNAVLLGRTSGAFCTALALHLTPDGEITIANAGHLPPYLDGKEVELSGMLPLGIAAAGEYEAATLTLPKGSRLTFYSDGIIEAQNPQGHLLGFDRARSISTKTATAIADEAVAFGQTDDITVVTIDRLQTDSH